jgi:hypothetical protein
MFRFLSFAVVGLALLVSPRFVWTQADYVSGTVLEITKQVENHPAVWVWDTPVFWSETVSYELHVRVGKEQIWCSYTPEIQPGVLPVTLRANGAIAVRIAKQRLFILRPSGGELETVLLRRTR